MTDLKLSLLIQAIDQFSGPAQKMASVSEKMSEKMMTGQRALNDLGKTGKMLQGLEAGQRKLGQTAAAMDRAREETARLGREMAKTEKPTAGLKRQFDAARKRSDKLRQSHRSQKDELKQLRSQLREAGFDTRKLGDAQKQVANDLDRTTKKMEKMVQAGAKMEAAQARYDRALQRAANVSLVGAGLQHVGQTAMGMVADPLNEMRATERAKGELQSLDIQDTASIVKAGQAMATTFAGMNTAGFVSAAYDIKSGISSLTDTGVADMTRLAALTAKATKANVGQMTSLFATSYGSFKESLYATTSDTQFGEVLSASLSAAVKQFKTDGTKMQQAIESMGSGLAQSGVSLADQFTALGLLQQKMTAGESGTSMAAVERTAAQAQERFEKLGLAINTLDENGNLRSLPDLLEEMQQAFGDDYSTEIGAQIQEAFGSDEAVKFFKGLWGQQDKFRQAAKEIEKAQMQGAQHTASMAKNMDRNMDARLAVMEQRWSIIKEKLGHAMVPILEKLIPLVERGVHWFDRFVEGNGSLTTGIMATLGVVGALAMTMAPVVTAMSSLVVASAWASKSFTRLKNSVAMAGMAADIEAGGSKRRRGRGLKGILKSTGGKLGIAGAVVTGGLAIGSTLSNDNMSKGEKAAAISQDVGNLGGAAAGAMAGAALGSVVPVIGTAIGSIIGGIVGGFGGDFLGQQIGKLFLDDEKETQLAQNNMPTPLGGGNPTELAGMALPTPIDMTAVPASGPTQVSHTQNNTFHITQQPEQDADELAQTVKRKIDESQRGALHD